MWYTILRLREVDTQRREKMPSTQGQSRESSRKYSAVITMNCQNMQVSPWFSSAQDARNWMNDNGKKCDAIMPAVNWRELMHYQRTHGEKVWQVIL